MDTFYWFIPILTLCEDEEDSLNCSWELGEVGVAVSVDNNKNPISAILEINHTDYNLKLGSPAFESLSAIKGWTEEEYLRELNFAITVHYSEEDIF